MIELRPEDLRKKCIKALHNYIALFEEYLENAPDEIEVDNFPDYREAVTEYNKLAAKKYDATGALIKLEDIENKSTIDKNNPYTPKGDLKF